MAAGSRIKRNMDGHAIEARFIFFSESAMTAKEYGWMVWIDDEQRQGVFDTVEDALGNAEELVQDLDAETA